MSSHQRLLNFWLHIGAIDARRFQLDAEYHAWWYSLAARAASTLPR